ncbi:MAG: FkbM family methyltransferase [Anaerolineaceae bacterium]|nr:FkbM family methyltransferase [Anaerolineaceae bacterium]
MQLAIRDFLRKLDFDITRLSYGRSLAGRLKILTQTLDIDCVLDVGANIGKYAMSMRALGYNGPIVSFEPASLPFRTLREKTKKDRLWNAHQIALGSSEGDGSLNVMQDSGLNSFYTPNEYGAKCFADDVVDHQETVSVKRLDSISAVMPEIHRSRNVFLKIDTQGHDLEVFRGSSGYYPQIALLQMELSVCPIYKEIPDWMSVIKEVEKTGFVLGGLFAVSYNNACEVIEFDGLFIRKRPDHGEGALR